MSGVGYSQCGVRGGVCKVVSCGMLNVPSACLILRFMRGCRVCFCCQSSAGECCCEYLVCWLGGVSSCFCVKTQ